MSNDDCVMESTICIAVTIQSGILNRLMVLSEHWSYFKNIGSEKMSACKSVHVKSKDHD